MEGNLFVAFPSEIWDMPWRWRGEKQHPNVSFFRNIACFDLSCFFVLCNAYSVSDERRMYTKNWIKQRAERIVCGGGLVKGGQGNVLFLKRNEKCCKKDGCRKKYLKMRFSE
jgi:hypothetical protein